MPDDTWKFSLIIQIYRFKNNVLYVDYIGSESHSCYQIMYNGTTNSYFDSTDWVG